LLEAKESQQNVDHVATKEQKEEQEQCLVNFIINLH